MEGTIPFIDYLLDLSWLPWAILAGALYLVLKIWQSNARGVAESRRVVLGDSDEDGDAETRELRKEIRRLGTETANLSKFMLLLPEFTKQLTSHQERHQIGSKDTLLVERLSGDLLEPALEMWRVTLFPGVSSGRQAIEYDGEEIVNCEAGEVTFCLGEQEYVLATGDSLHFKASIPHFWRNDGSSPARFTVTGTLPRKFRAALRQQMGALGSR